jgi:hypothetical protein
MYNHELFINYSTSIKGGWMVFGEIVGSIIDSFVPVDTEFIGRSLIAQPVPPHVPCFGTSLLNVGMNKTGCGQIVGLDRRRWLGMA